MVILTDKQGLLSIVEKSELIANGLDNVRLRPGVSRLEMARRDRIHTGLNGKCSILSSSKGHQFQGTHPARRLC